MSKDTSQSSDNAPNQSDSKDRHSSQVTPSSVVTEEGLSATTETISTKHWEVLLGEFVHLLSLFITKSQSSNDSRTAEVVFDQLVRHLEILEKMPNNDGNIFIRRTHCKIQTPPLDNNYFAMCGALLVKANQEAASQRLHTGAPPDPSEGESALYQAFKCFSDQGIHSIRIQLPQGDKSKIDKLRLALNIVAHFKPASEGGSSIRIRYYGRALTFSVIHNNDGQPDVNLTLTAALNGLSPVNARELVKQANAFHTLNATDADGEGSPECISSYNQIFSVRSLRSQIIKPPVEVNNIPWLEVANDATNEETCRASFSGEDSSGGAEAAQNSSQTVMNATPITPYLKQEDSLEEIQQLLSQYIDLEGDQLRSAAEALMADDYENLEPVAIGERIVALTRLMYDLEKQCHDPSTIARVIEFYRHRLKKTPESVLSNIMTQRQGLKIVSKGRIVIVGLVHPKLFDLITLVSENVAARRRMSIIKEIAFNFDPCHMSALADGFGISEKDAHHILEILKDCFSIRGSFIRPTFEGRLGLIAEFENAIFEILWCFLKETPRRQDRLDFLNALQLLMAKLKNPKRGIQFLLADICHIPTMVGFTDRNAFSLANILLHRENRELYVDINRTPEDVLATGRRIHKEARQYSLWRLDADRIRMLTKLRTLHHTIEETLRIPPGKSGPFEISFLLALEREALIFLGVVGGLTARIFLREMLAQYGTTDSELYGHASAKINLSEMMAQLQIVVRALGRAGNIEDIEMLRELGENGKSLYKLDTHPAHKLKVGQLMKLVPETIKMIRG